MYTINEVGVVAAFPQLHHRVEEVGDTGSPATSSPCTSFGEEREILLQNGPIVFLLDVGQLHLTTTIIDPIIFSFAETFPTLHNNIDRTDSFSELYCLSLSAEDNISRISERVFIPTLSSDTSIMGPTSMMVSSLGARFFSTSSFNLLNIMGFRMPCNFWT